MHGIFIYITGEDKDKLLSSGLNCRGCGQLPVITGLLQLSYVANTVSFIFGNILVSIF